MLDNLAARWVAVVMAAAIAAVIFFAPRSISSPQYEDLSPQQARLELGRAYVESSQSPMVGIKILQQVLKDDPKNHYVRWYLGTQAIRTGQYRKAINHLKVLYPELKGEEKANSLSALAFAYENMQNLDSARICYEMVLDISKDSLLLQSSKTKINLLNNR